MLDTYKEDSSKFYVYAHVRPDKNEVFYVGKGKGNRCYSINGRNEYWNRIVNKNNGVFTVQILAENLLEDLALDLEVALIAQFKERGVKLCNMTDGGEGVSGYKHTEETLKTMSESKIGDRNPMFGKTADKYPMYGKTGDKHPMYGKTGDKHPMYGKTGVLAPMYGRTGEKSYMFGRTGDKHPMFGRTGDKHPSSKIVIQIDKETNQIIREFSSAKEAQRTIGIQYTNITACCRGKIKSAGGFIWKYK